MPRRMLEESICYSDDLDRLTAFEETVFYRLLVNCDDYGRFDARPEFMKSRLFVTKRGITDKSIADAVAKLALVGIIRRYEVGGRPYLLFPTWHAHQRLRDSRARYPAPQDSGTAQCAATRGQPPPEPEQEPETEDQSETEDQPETERRRRAGAREEIGALVDRYTRNPAVAEALAGYLEMRDAKKKPATRRALELVMQSLDKLSGGDDAQRVALLDQSTRNGWTDVYPLSQTGQGQAASRPAREVAQHRYTQRTYAPGDLDGLYYDVGQAARAPGEHTKEGEQP